MRPAEIRTLYLCFAQHTAGITLNCTVNSVLCEVYIVQFDVYSVQCTLLNVQITENNVQCSLCCVHCHPCHAESVGMVGGCLELRPLVMKLHL